MNEKDVTELSLMKVATIPIATVRKMMQSSLQDAISEVPNERIPEFMTALFRVDEHHTIGGSRELVFLMYTAHTRFRERIEKFVREESGASLKAVAVKGTN